MSLISHLGISLLASTYWDDLLIVISPALPIYAVRLDRPKGIFYRHPKITVACWDTVVEFVRSDSPKNRKGDFFALKTIHYIGSVNSREVAGDLIACAGLSCVATLSPVYSVTPAWKPYWISEIVPEDRCHVNGIALDEDGALAYVTALGKKNTPSAWRENPNNGVLIDAKKQKVIAANLAMPHSPRLVDNCVWFCASSVGALMRHSLKSGKTHLVYSADGYLRGLAFYDRYAFVGISRMRYSKNQWVDGGGRAGIAIIDLDVGEEVEFIEIKCSEIFDVQVLPIENPVVVGLDSSLITQTLSLPK